MIKVFIINGQGGAGKNTFVDFIYDFEEYVYEMSSIDPIKEIAKKFCWNQAKTEKDRKFLSDLKNLSIEYNNFPFTYCLNKIYKIQNNLKYIDDSKNVFIFVFIREPKEILKLRDALISQKIFCETILIKRPFRKLFNNQSDDNVYNFLYDHEIENFGTLEDLKEKAKLFIDEQN